jgi:hypothetical protein
LGQTEALPEGSYRILGEPGLLKRFPVNLLKALPTYLSKHGPLAGHGFLKPGHSPFQVGIAPLEPGIVLLQPFDGYVNLALGNPSNFVLDDIWHSELLWF